MAVIIDLNDDDDDFGFFSFVLLPVILIILVSWLLKGDADFSLKFYQYFGKKPAKYFEGKVVWITGASSGIGEQLAYNLSKLGRPVTLILSARRINELVKVKRKCSELSKISTNRVEIVPLDLLQFEKHESVVDQVWNLFGKVDVVIHNAGQSQRASWHEIDPTVDEDCFRLNALAPTNLTRHLLKRYLVAGKPDLHVAVVSSISGVLGASSCASYVAAKHALNGYLRALQTDFADCANLKVTICCPGLVFAPNNPMNAFTGSSGVKHAEVISAPVALHMMPDHCANLIITAAANQVSECWISKHPVLLYTYLRVYWPSLANMMFKLYGLEKMKKMREGKQ